MGIAELAEWCDEAVRYWARINDPGGRDGE